MCNKATAVMYASPQVVKANQIYVEIVPPSGTTNWSFAMDSLE
jgi:hypothetical protein